MISSLQFYFGGMGNGLVVIFLAAVRSRVAIEFTLEWMYAGSFKSSDSCLEQWEEECMRVAHSDEMQTMGGCFSRGGRISENLVSFHKQYAEYCDSKEEDATNSGIPFEMGIEYSSFQKNSKKSG